MGYFNSRGLRGSVLEEMVNISNESYRKKGIALIQKIPTPIKPVEFDSARRTISLAYFEQRSTVDYIGVMQGIPLCFDAKETAQKNLPVANIHPHQVDFMREFNRQQGLAFLLVHFSMDDAYYLLPFEVLNTYFDEAGEHKGVKTIPREIFEERFRIQQHVGGIQLHYLKAVVEYYKIKQEAQDGSV
ncbi:MAG: Holliday junction resolvase RecU [Firmicutes bacterium]|nr:Holliday junction resolvase RecU [Bacillota bacterium]